MPDLHSFSAHLPPALLVVFRIGGLTVFGPVFGSPAVPVRVKVLLSFLVGAAVYPLLSASAFAETRLALDVWTIGPAVASELLVGVIVGYLASIPFAGIQMGGLVMGQQMGLGFARFYNPGIDDEADVIGQILFFLMLAGFLAVGGHEAMLLAVLRSFEHVPLGGFALDGGVLSLILGLLHASIELALRVAAPVLAIVFLQSLAMGYMAKTVPQLNILSLGFLVRILVGIAIVMAGLVVINDVGMDAVDEMLEGVFGWVGGA